MLIENRNVAGVGMCVFTNTYSPTVNRLRVTELDGTLVTFGYDPSSQLVAEARGGTMAYARSYVWDPNGNRVQQYDNGVLTTGKFNAANQQTLITPSSGAPTTRTFDLVGNLTLENTGGALSTSTWSPENRLLSYTPATGTAIHNLYSDDGLRKQRIEGTVTTNFTYDEVVLALETAPSSVLDARYTNYPGAWGGLTSQNRSGVSWYYGFDSQASARILVSSAGVVTDSYSWMAFGEPIQTGSGTDNPYGYVALMVYYTELPDLINAWNRWPQPSAKQWRSMDPIGFDGGSWSLYPIVGNNPVNWTDPTGLINSACAETREGAKPGEKRVPWKLILDPAAPEQRIKTNPGTTVTLTCFIIVDQFCDPFRDAHAEIDESVNQASHGCPLDNQSWNPMGQVKDKVRMVPGTYSHPPRFCDPVIGPTHMAVQDNLQCFSVLIHGKRFILQPCPYRLQFGPNGPVRTALGGLATGLVFL